MRDTNDKVTPEQVRDLLNKSITSAVAMYKAECGYNVKDFSRNRKLNMETMIRLLIFMKGGSIQKELYDAGINVWKSAFSQAREKISWTDIENTLEDFNERCKDMDVKRYKGYRVLAIDGTAVNIPRNPDSDSYIQTKSNIKGYNQLHANMLYDILNQTYIHCTIDPDEIGGLLFLLNWFEFSPDTLVIADRGYEAYNTFAHFMEKGIKFLIRVKQKNSSMREIRRLPMEELDIDISFTLTTTQTKEDKAKKYIYVQQTRKGKERKRWDFPSPYPMTLRVVRVLLDSGEYETLATNLSRDAISAEDIKELYHRRWDIELGFRSIKYTEGLSNLHGKSEEFAKQEIFSSMVFANFCSRIINQTSIENDGGRMHEYKVNRKMAVDLCREFYQGNKANGTELLREIEKYTEPVREGRKDERNLKSKSFAGFNYRVT